VIASLTDRELGHVLAALRLHQRVAGHSADLDDIATDAGEHEPMSPGEIDDLCEHLNLGQSVENATRGLLSMVILNDGETWTSLDRVELVFLPADADGDVLCMYDNGEDADHIVPEVEFKPPSGVFDLDRLVRELPMEVLERYRLRAGKGGGG
jgi:hypothetical protein